MVADTIGGEGARPAQANWGLAIIVALAAFMEVLDTSIANVALQHIAGNLSASRDEATWVLTSYLVTNAIVLPITGWLSNVLGRKRFYTICIVGFGLSSLACGLSPTLSVLIAARALQGLLGGGLQPVSQAILADNFPQEKRGVAFSIFGMAVVFAPAIGPTLGGWITDNYSWHWIFLINVPISIAIAFVVTLMIEDPPRLVRERERIRREGIDFDLIGFALLALGLGCLQVVLDKGQEEDWFGSSLIVGMSLGSVGGLIAFVVWELNRKHPIVDLRLLANPNFAVSNFLMLLLGFVLLGSTALIPQMVQEIYGYTATWAGMVISPGGFVIILFMPIAGQLVARFDARILIATGFLGMAAVLWWMSGLTAQVDFWTLAEMRIFQAIFISLLFIPISTISYVGVPPDKNDAASALINLMRNLGSSIGISFLNTLVTRRAQFHQNVLVAHVTPYDWAYQHTVQVHQAQGMSLIQAQALIGRMVEQQARMLSYIDAFAVLACICVAVVPVLFLVRKNKNSGAGAGAAH